VQLNLFLKDPCFAIGLGVSLLFFFCWTCLFREQVVFANGGGCIVTGRYCSRFCCFKQGLPRGGESLWTPSFELTCLVKGVSRPRPANFSGFLSSPHRPSFQASTLPLDVFSLFTDFLQGRLGIFKVYIHPSLCLWRLFPRQS